MSHRHHSVFVILLTLACTSRERSTHDSARTRADAVPAAPAASVRDSTTPERASARWVVSPAGIGPIIAGMTLAAAGTALGEPLRATYDAGAACTYVRAAALPKDVLLMVQHDTVVRVDVRGTGVTTAEGAGVGDTEASVLARYDGRVHVTPHKYSGSVGHYLTVTALPDSAHAIVFETDGGVVVNYRAGRRDAVALVEGCS